MIAIDSTPFVETMRAFTVGLIVLTIVGALLVALLGYYIARVGLRPLDRVSREAQALTPERLSQRLQVSRLHRGDSETAGFHELAGSNPGRNR